MVAIETAQINERIQAFETARLGVDAARLGIGANEQLSDVEIGALDNMLGEALRERMESRGLA